VETRGWRLAGSIVNRHHVKPQRTFFQVSSAQEVVGGADKDNVLFLGDAQFRQSGLAFHGEARAHFHKSQCLAIEADQIDLALGARRSVVARDEDVPKPPQLPIGIGFDAYTGAQRRKPLLRGNRCAILRRRGILEAVAGLPLHYRKGDARQHVCVSLL
jgi:hypothetical protein